MIEFFLDNKPYYMGIQVHARVQQGEGMAYAQPIEWKVEDRANLGLTISPIFEFENQSAQSFMDQLWACGVRPSEGTGSAGSLKATENHLSDMRKIAFRGLKINE